METAFPNQTAKQLTLPHGDVVFIQTLNLKDQEEVRDSADLYQALKMLEYRPGGEYYKAKLAEYVDYDSDESVIFVSNVKINNQEWIDEAKLKFPIPVTPMREESEEEDKYLNKVAKWKKDREKIIKDREDYVNAKIEEEKTKIAGMSDSARAEYVYRVFRKEKAREYKIERYIHELIYRCTRKPDNHREKYFASLEDVINLDDETRAAIYNEYFNVDTITAESIPTSPTGS